MHQVTHEEVQRRAEHLSRQLRRKGLFRLYGVPRGGVIAAMAIRAEDPSFHIVDRPEDADALIDDIIDSGNTMMRFVDLYPNKPFTALFDKSAMQLPVQEWVVLPWEVNEHSSAEDIVTRLLQFIGEDPKRGGLQETPARVLKAWQHWTSGYATDPVDVLKTFKDGAERVDEMVLVRDIPFYSQCEHHLAPFFGVAHIAYIPDGKIVGLSKLSRLLDIFARRLQVQERLTNQVADALEENLHPKGVGVVIQARHLCMESRGICQQGHSTVTSALRGAMKEDHSARHEFLSLAGVGHAPA